MDDIIFNLVKKAKSENDIDTLKELTYKTDDYNIRNEYANLCVKKQKYEIAKKEYMILLNTKKKELAILNLGRIAVKEKEYDKARKYFDSLMGTDKEADTLYQLGKLELILENDNVAEEYFLNSLDLREDLYAFYELGKLEQKKENFLKAEEYFLEALKTNPNDNFSKFELARTKSKLGKYKDAIILIKGLIQFRKNKNLKEDYKLLTELSKNYILNCDYEEARKCLEKAISLAPNDLIIKYCFGWLEFCSKNYEIAKQYFEEVLEKKYDANTELFLGQTNRILGNLDSAKKHLENCYSKSNKKGKVLFELGLLELKNKNINGAIENFEQAIKHECKINIYTSLVLSYIKNNELEKAVSFIEKNSFLKLELSRIILLYLSKALNIFYKDLDYTNLSYSEIQLLDYDELKTIDYLEKIKTKKFYNNKEFNEVDLYSLLINAKEHLKEENKIYKLSLLDVYKIEIDGTLFKVITLPHTKDIITIYPSCDRNYIYKDEDISVEMSYISKKM